MRRYAIVAAMIVSTGAVGQEVQTVDAAQCNATVSAVRDQRITSDDRAAQLSAAISMQSKELEKLKTVKSEQDKKNLRSGISG